MKNVEYFLNIHGIVKMNLLKNGVLFFKKRWTFFKTWIIGRNGIIFLKPWTFSKISNIADLWLKYWAFLEHCENCRHFIKILVFFEKLWPFFKRWSFLKLWIFFKTWNFNYLTSFNRCRLFIKKWTFYRNFGHLIMWPFLK